MSTEERQPLAEARTVTAKAVAAFETSVETDQLDAALAKAQGEIQEALKNKTNSHFGSSYADLAAVWEACRAALSKHGISVTQWPLHSTDERLHLVTRLAFAGQWMRAHFSIPVSKRDAHGYGSATTYAKRFALSAAVGVVADEDDDANGAAEAGKRQQTGGGRQSNKRSGRQANKRQEGKRHGGQASARGGETGSGETITAEDRARAAAIKDLQAALVRLYPKSDAASKKKKLELVESAVGVSVWNHVYSLSPERIRAGIKLIKERERPGDEEALSAFARAEEAVQAAESPVAIDEALKEHSGLPQPELEALGRLADKRRAEVST